MGDRSAGVGRVGHLLRIKAAIRWQSMPIYCLAAIDRTRTQRSIISVEFARLGFSAIRSSALNGHQHLLFGK